MTSFFSSSSETNLSTARTIISTAATFAAAAAASAMILRSVTDEFLPMELRHYIYTKIKNAYYRLSPDLTMVIEEFEGLDNNQIYSAAEIYLGTIASPSTRKLRVSKFDHQQTYSLTMERDQSVTDYFKGVKLNWTLFFRHVENLHRNRDISAASKTEIRSLELTFHRKHQNLVLDQYIPFILEEARSKKQELKALRIFTVDHQNLYGNLNDAWVGTTLDHPSTFDTLALDRDLREFVTGDLEKFVRRKEYYKKVGKAWKRGYLLYGPPGTGKSSLIAAMANYLHFDIYDLELTELNSNDELRRLLIAMPNRSILVIEDIDCTVEFQDRNSQSLTGSGRSRDRQVTLSGLLNFIDGLWSSCGDERIIVFTTNHKEKLDSALLRPGRMDVHIHMSYCTPYGFRQLAFNYLGIKENPRFREIEAKIEKTLVTPAEIAEQLLKGAEIGTVLEDLLGFLTKKKESQEVEAKKRKQEELKDDSDGSKGNGVIGTTLKL
ncbi:protein HYPER-SENSITIVITY-RELATED 4-like [Vicia villosa]|uniref:protein HYPER-SENSITIVITY-RELATED 4-like n=1 Tax=Vicia villosa TaxID=3911 RepID=UPI00273A9308|nr:protein HYPER-SENSITIVITY-RELATED 4-like [Vicia villosa]